MYSLYETNQIFKKKQRQFTQISIGMSKIFINSENSYTSGAYCVVLNLTNNLDLRTGDKLTALSNITIYFTWKNIKKSRKNNKFKISGLT